jgi:hypothetical protein
MLVAGVDALLVLRNVRSSDAQVRDFYLRRSNALNYHFVMGGIYGDVIYHHGAGGRRAKFRIAGDVERNEQISVALRDAAFADVDHLVAVLRGQVSNDLDLTPL